MDVMKSRKKKTETWNRVNNGVIRIKVHRQAFYFLIMSIDCSEFKSLRDFFKILFEHNLFQKFTNLLFAKIFDVYSKACVNAYAHKNDWQ